MNTNENENQIPEGSSGTDEARDTGPRVSAGALIREAREKAGIPAAKLCADLRISPATLEALEAGQYEKLAGAPYVRAMLVSLSRHLRLETKDVLKAYADEIGEQAAPAAQVSPYKDDSGTYAKAHKQIFILILAVLLFILLLIMGKVNTSAPEPEPEAPAAGADPLLNIDPVAGQDSLLHDSLDLSDSAAVDSAAAASPAAAASAAAQDDEYETRVKITALADSVWLRILPAGSREVSQYLRRNKPLEFTHGDAITFITRTGGSLRVHVGDSIVVPAGRRFKVDGNQVTY